MDLTGNYFCAEPESKLIIFEADNNNGSAKGFFEMKRARIPVTIHYHAEGAFTNLWFAGNQDNPNEYVGGAGRINNDSSEVIIQLAGGYPTYESVEAFKGNYMRQ